MKYRHKPTEVEAIQWTGDNLSEIFTLTGRVKRDNLPSGQIGIYSPLESSGYRSAVIGDWIVKTPDGDVRPMKAEVFTAAYEPTA